jgi:hypothetical protein
LFELVGEGDVETVRHELALHPLRVHERRNGLGLLHVAGDPVLVRLLIAAGLDVNEPDKSGCMPLHRAAQDASADVAEALLGHGAQVDARDWRDQTPLHWLTGYWLQTAEAQARVSKVGELLLSKGACPDPIDDYGRTPLHDAARHGRLELLRRLLVEGADPRRRDMYGRNARHWARDESIIAVLDGWVASRGASWVPEVSEQSVLGVPHIRLRLLCGRDRGVTIAGRSVLAGWTLCGEPELACVATGHGTSIIDIDTDIDQSVIAVAWSDGPVEIRKWDTPQDARRVGSVIAGGAVAICLRRDLIAAANPECRVVVLRASTGEQTSIVDGWGRTQSLAFDHDGHYLAVAKSDQADAAVELHAIDSEGRAKALFEIERPPLSEIERQPTIDTIDCVRFAPHGQSLLVWETSSCAGETSSEPDGFRGNLTVISVAEGSVLWEITVGSQITGVSTTLPGIGAPIGWLTEPAFSNDASRIAIGLDGVLIEIDAATGDVISRRTVGGHISSVAPSHHDGAWLTAGSEGVALVRRE